MIYFISDTHFFHKLAAQKRGFSSLDNMNEYIIECWNKTIQKKDDVFILGDFAFDRKGNVGPLLERLKGRKHLILGNHDHFIRSGCNVSIYESLVEVCHYKELKYNKVKFILFHYPISEWNFKRFGSIHLHGHLHRDISTDKNRLNVSADLLDYKPISIQEVMVLCNN